jgi:hypothetical protein
MAPDHFAKARAEALASVDPAGRRELVCERCGVRFACRPAGSCWCNHEAFRLPVPLPEPFTNFGDCLCPACLRHVAAALGGAGTPTGN